MNNLHDIFQNIPVIPTNVSEIPAINITGITLDSREIKPGNVFVAVEGTSVDGHHYISKAIENGASLVIGSHSQNPEWTVPYLQVEEPRFALAYIAAALEDFPARKMTMIGVTGTDGKTTTSTIIHNILKAAGLQAGLITTVSAIIGDEELDTGFHVTTPEAVDVQHYLAQMAETGLTHVVLETTSHGLAQHRATACEFDIGVVTNITHEHLDYHGSYTAYQAAKAKLFEDVSRSKSKAVEVPNLSVLNRDDQSFSYLESIANSPQQCYSTYNSEASVWASDIQHRPDGLHFIIHDRIGQQPIQSRQVGNFNVSNILAAYTAAVHGLNIPPQIAAKAIADMPGVPGRMERIDMGQNFLAIVDFAHTPNALTVALETLNAIKPESGKVWAVFGSAGLRDREKRAMMAKVSAKHADYTIITAEDPRTESLEGILEMMESTAENNGATKNVNLWSIADRGAAIQFAVNHAGENDIVCAFGKGHEQSMCFGTTEYPWDDRIAMQSALAAFLNIKGPEMPILPTSDKI